jgi:cytochrome P450
MASCQNKLPEITMAQFEPIDIASHTHKANAHSVYTRLRTRTPVCRVILPTRQEAWLLTRYKDVSHLFKDTRFAKDPANAMTKEQLAHQRIPPKMFAPLTRNMLAMDDPDHARLKRLVQAGFTPRRMETLAKRTQEITENLIGKFKNKERFDLMSEFAMNMPVTVISELLGVPEPDRTKFARWSHTLLSVPLGSWRVIFSLPDMIRFMRYLRKLVALKRDKPGDDLVSSLVEIEADGDQLDGEELLAMIAILLSAGHETTTNLIGNGMLALLQNPAQLEQLRSEPTLIDAAVEELLRYASPVETSTFRYAREAVDIAGVQIPQGGIVLGVIASANRDEEQFPNAGIINLARTPNRHLTFGEGGHYCVGAALARMEGRIALSGLLRHFPGLALDQPVDSLKWRPGLVLRGLEQLSLKA